MQLSAEAVWTGSKPEKEKSMAKKISSISAKRRCTEHKVEQLTEIPTKKVEMTVKEL